MALESTIIDSLTDAASMARDAAVFLESDFGRSGPPVTYDFLQVAFRGAQSDALKAALGICETMLDFDNAHKDTVVEIATAIRELMTEHGIV